RAPHLRDVTLQLTTHVSGSRQAMRDNLRLKRLGRVSFGVWMAPSAFLSGEDSSSTGVPGCRRQFLPIQRRPVQQQPNPVQDITANDPDLGLDLKEATAE